MCESFRCSLSYAHKVSGNYNFGFGSNEGHVMPPDFFLQGLRVNAAAYIKVLEAIVKLWIDNMRGKRPRIPTGLCSFTQSYDDARLDVRESA